MPLRLGTDKVSPDEPCFQLSEVNLQSPGSRGFHRYQILLVVRGDQIAEYRLDLGLASRWKADQIRIPGGVKNGNRYHILHTVGELQEIAAKMRDMPSHRPDPTDFYKLYQRKQEMLRAPEMVFGPAVQRGITR